MMRPGRSLVVALSAAAALTGLAGCGAEPAAADLDQQVDWGAAVHQWHCARCHDADRSALELTPEVIQTWDSAEELFEYNRSAMPLDEPGRLPDSDYWAVTAYLLDRSGLLEREPDEPLGPDGNDDGADE